MVRYLPARSKAAARLVASVMAALPHQLPAAPHPVEPRGIWPHAFEQERPIVERIELEGVVGTSLDLLIECEGAASRQVEQAVLRRIEELRRHWDRRDPASAVSGLRDGRMASPTPELKELLELYALWHRRTGGLVNSGSDGFDLDALGKALLTDRAARAAWQAAEGGRVLLNIGGDIAAVGGPWRVGIAHPDFPDSAPHRVGLVTLHGSAIATSGVYARGSHIRRLGMAGTVAGVLSASVVAHDLVTANALATAICAGSVQAMGDLLRQYATAWLVMLGDGSIQSSGITTTAPSAASEAWPVDHQVTLTLRLKAHQGKGNRRPYVAVWVENASGHCVRTISEWGRERKYVRELPVFWNAIGRDMSRVDAVSRATRPAGVYELVWNGRDDDGNALPQGTYTLCVEIARENGGRVLRKGSITAGETIAEATLEESTEAEAIKVRYGPPASSE